MLLVFKTLKYELLLEIITFILILYNNSKLFIKIGDWLLLL